MTVIKFDEMAPKCILINTTDCNFANMIKLQYVIILQMHIPIGVFLRGHHVNKPLRMLLVDKTLVLIVKII